MRARRRCRQTTYATTAIAGTTNMTAIVTMTTGVDVGEAVSWDTTSALR